MYERVVIVMGIVERLTGMDLEHHKRMLFRPSVRDKLLRKDYIKKFISVTIDCVLYFMIYVWFGYAIFNLIRIYI